MKRWIRSLAIVSAAASLIGFGVLPQAGASGTSNATCEVKTGVVLTPGITATPSKGTFVAKGGTLSCQTGSSLGGHPITNSSSVVISGVYGSNGPGDNCAAGSGSGKFVVKFPSRGTTYTASGTFTFVRVGVALAVKGTLAGATMGGVLDFTPPTSQNCATTPVTKATVDGFVHAQ
jgi:hypothetical protein